MAGLLTYYFYDSATEAELLEDILEHIPKESIENRKKEGLSLFDLKGATKRKNFCRFVFRKR